jgi:hypothetical protein
LVLFLAMRTYEDDDAAPAKAVVEADGEDLGNHDGRGEVIELFEVLQWIVKESIEGRGRTLLSKRWSARFSAGNARAEAPAARLRMFLKLFMARLCWLLWCW